MRARQHSLQRAHLPGQLPARMWLFRVITLLDSNLTWTIEQLHPDGRWEALISEGRRHKARALWDERRRRGSDCRLVECLQIKDKADVLFKNADHLKLLGLTSRREADRLARDIELLRNHLAHGQELEAGHLATASRLAESLEGILRADLASRLVERQRTHPKPEPSPPRTRHEQACRRPPGAPGDRPQPSMNCLGWSPAFCAP